MNDPGVGTLMSHIEEVLSKTFIHAIFYGKGKEIDVNFQKILGHSIKRGRLGIPNPQLSAESA